jgi:biotin carboxyl carrier protein
MKLQAELNNEKHDVEIRRDGDKVFATIDGRSYELEASEPEPNVFLLKHEGRIYEVYVSPGQLSRVRIGSNEFEISIHDPKRLRGSGADHEHGEGLAEIRTAMPGKVVRIVVKTGTEVKKGDGIIVVEAMKMQNEMKSPKDGIVKEIRASEGITVNAGDILAIIE